MSAEKSTHLHNVVQCGFGHLGGGGGGGGFSLMNRTVGMGYIDLTHQLDTYLSLQVHWNIHAKNST